MDFIFRELFIIMLSRCADAAMSLICTVLMPHIIRKKEGAQVILYSRVDICISKRQVLQ